MTQDKRLLCRECKWFKDGYNPVCTHRAASSLTGTEQIRTYYMRKGICGEEGKLWEPKKRWWWL